MALVTMWGSIMLVEVYCGLMEVLEDMWEATDEEEVAAGKWVGEAAARVAREPRERLIPLEEVCEPERVCWEVECMC